MKNTGGASLSSTTRGKGRLGIYCPGNGTGGPWRYVHSIVAGLDPTEFDVTLICDLPGQSPPRPAVRVARLNGAAAFDGGAPVRPAEPAAASRPATGRQRRWLPAAA